MYNPVAYWYIKAEVLLLTVERLCVEVDIPDLVLGWRGDNIIGSNRSAMVGGIVRRWVDRGSRQWRNGSAMVVFHRNILGRIDWRWIDWRWRNPRQSTACAQRWSDKAIVMKFKSRRINTMDVSDEIMLSLCHGGGCNAVQLNILLPGLSALNLLVHGVALQEGGRHLLIMVAVVNLKINIP